MFEQVILKDKNISEKALHLSLQKIYTHKQGNNHSLDRSEVAGSGKKLFKQKGTGNARAGNKKTTQRRGGGKVHRTVMRDWSSPHRHCRHRAPSGRKPLTQRWREDQNPQKMVR